MKSICVTVSKILVTLQKVESCLRFAHNSPTVIAPKRFVSYPYSQWRWNKAYCGQCSAELSEMLHCIKTAPCTCTNENMPGQRNKTFSMICYSSCTHWVMDKDHGKQATSGNSCSSSCYLVQI
ncbi:hypothetical protein EGW08_000734 [Elysia chlorotica]|uniref:Uncharacterized protein n=1 Tax=Elysia chlorotica TaxID=188477 RepID=A0A3S1A1I9_ELYCH|nr:hypothetical protein EGW08_000734 [Elysia chlorotica]